MRRNHFGVSKNVIVTRFGSVANRGFLQVLWFPPKENVDRAISFPEPAIPWEGNGGSGIIRDRHTKNRMSPVLRMRWK